jgi:hypothetical protein
MKILLILRGGMENFADTSAFNAGVMEKNILDTAPDNNNP